MSVLRLIEHKRDGHELSPSEMECLVTAYLDGSLADYQFSAFLMACCIRGLSVSETTALTRVMVDSGDRLDLSGLSPVVDKHSTGGVGDKTTLIVAPMVASLGVHVAKLSGRGLGHTGGTLDKLQAIPGMRTDLTVAELKEQAGRVGVAVSGQTAELVPADRRIYALRDVTGTVPSVGLIAASVMSKKVAGGAEAVVLDVKFGSGAFMKTREGADELAAMMVGIGESMGLPTRTLLSTMDDVLGHAVGNALEVTEAVEVLRGRGPSDTRAVCVELAAQMLLASGLYSDESAARADSAAVLDDGRALERFILWIDAQGGDARVADDPDDVLPDAAVQLPVISSTAGIISSVDVELIGRASVALGAGRARIDDIIDAAAGIIVHKKLGASVVEGEPLATLYAATHELAEAGAMTVTSAWEVSG